MRFRAANAHKPSYKPLTTRSGQKSVNQAGAKPRKISYAEAHSGICARLEEVAKFWSEMPNPVYAAPSSYDAGNQISPDLEVATRRTLNFAFNLLETKRSTTNKELSQENKLIDTMHQVLVQISGVDPSITRSVRPYFVSRYNKAVNHLQCESRLATLNALHDRLTPFAKHFGSKTADPIQLTPYSTFSVVSREPRPSAMTVDWNGNPVNNLSVLTSSYLFHLLR